MHRLQVQIDMSMRVHSVIAWKQATLKLLFRSSSLLCYWMSTFLIALDPCGNKLYSYSKHSTFIYWPWRVLFIQIEIKCQKRKEIIPWLNLPSWSKQITQGEHYCAQSWDNEQHNTDRTAYIFIAYSCRGDLTCGTKRQKPTSPIWKLVEILLWGVVICSLCVLLSIKVAVIELLGWQARWKKRASISRADCKSLGPPESSICHPALRLWALCRTHRPTFWNVRAIKPNGFNVRDLVVSNAISLNPICGEIALER